MDQDNTSQRLERNMNMRGEGKREEREKGRQRGREGGRERLVNGYQVTSVTGCMEKCPTFSSRQKYCRIKQPERGLPCPFLEVAMSGFLKISRVTPSIFPSFAILTILSRNQQKRKEKEKEGEYKSISFVRSMFASTDFTATLERFNGLNLKKERQTKTEREKQEEREREREKEGEGEKERERA
jgi:hypothetical protein